MAEYGIGDLAAEFHLTYRTLRFWEQIGILNPERRGLDRIYTTADRDWVRNVVAWSAAGFSLREIETMRSMTPAVREDYLRKRLSAIQSDADAAYANQCRAIEAVMATIPEPRRAHG
ncbi:MerR family transcriptional regulator [Kaistia terrae]|uniref:MerR family transcriptional regulator n=1 Tax=Kaistia terrae TaxID=537017 RepID=A0ABW0Q2A6_9HYPH